MVQPIESNHVDLTEGKRTGYQQYRRQLQRYETIEPRRCEASALSLQGV